MKNSSHRETLAEKAAACLLCLEDPDADPRVKLHWQSWLAERPSHRVAFETCKALWTAPASPDLAWPTADEIARDTYLGDEPIRPRGRKILPADRFRFDAEHDRFRRRIPAAGAAIVVLTVVAIAISAIQVLSPVPGGAGAGEMFVTARAEQRQVRLSDGSQIILGPESRLEVRYDSKIRRFELRNGEAIFTAMHDVNRPFRVFAGAGWVEDIGTAFSVRTGTNGVTVTVLRGEVAVNSGTDNATAPAGARLGGTKLVQNQQITYGATLGSIHKVDSALVTAWSHGQLAYIDQPLGDVLADLRRYSLKDVVVQDPAIEALHYTGTISVENLDQWAAGLARAYPVRVNVSGSQLVLASAPSAN